MDLLQLSCKIFIICYRRELTAAGRPFDQRQAKPILWFRKWLLSLYSENNFFYYFHCGRLATSDDMILLARRRSRVRTQRPARGLFPFFQNSFFQNIILGFRQAKLYLRV